MRLILPLLIFFASVSAAMSQPVVVRSGTHPGFTRLVFYLPEETTWKVEEGSEGAVLSTTPPTPFDITKVYNRIGRDRLENIRVGAKPGQVFMDLACDCTIRTETLIGNTLVLDLVAPEPQVESPGVADVGPPVGQDDQSPAQANQPATVKPDFSRITDARRLPDELTKPFGGELDGEAIARSQNLAQVEREMLEQVARATTRGLLTASLGPKEAPEKVASEPEENPRETEPAQVSEPTKNAAAHTNIGDEPSKPAASVANCIADEDLDLASWTGSDGFVRGLGQLRSGLGGEVEETDPKAALSLAKFYIGYGFGAEASQMLSLMHESSESLRLGSMARILELGHDPYASPFENQAGCETSAALWAILSSTDPNLTRDAQDATILRGLNSLPPAVREYLGLALAETYLNAGDEDMSRAILRVLDRMGGDRGDKHKLVEGRTELSEGDFEKGEEKLQESAEAGAEPSPEALIALVDHKLTVGDPIDQDVSDLISAYAFQYRSSELERPLRRSEILARASVGQFDPAFRLLEAYGEEFEAAEDLNLLRSRVTASLTSKADDATFLRLGLVQAQQHAETLEPETAVALADRFLTLGLPDLVHVALPQTADGKAAEDRKVLRAKADVANGMLSRAEEELQGLVNASASALLAEIAAKRGDHATASKAFATIGMDQQSQEQAWLAGNWEDVNQSADESLKALAALMRDETSEPADPTLGPLARNRRLAEDAAASRASLQTLLSNFDIEPLPSN